MGQKTEELKALCTKLGRRYVGFRGNPKAPLWFVGEAPGADEDQAGVPFVGSSGRELDRMLVEAGISLSDCCFVNPYKVRPPNNDMERIEETGITKKMFEEQFWEELNENKPSFISPTGGTSLSLLCPYTIDPRDKESKISKWRGSLLNSEQLRWSHYIIPNFHPAYILREWSDRDVGVFIFRRLKEEFDYWKLNKKHQPLPERELISNPTYGEAKEYLHACLNHRGPVSADFELLARRIPICISYALSPFSAISISLWDGDSTELSKLWKLMDRVHSEKVILGQNWTTFDANWAESIGLNSGIARCEDTLVRHHVLHPELSHKLDMQVMQYTRESYYKDEGKGWQLREGMQKLKRYNCKDSACTYEVFLEQEKEFDDNPKLRAFYDYEIRLARAFHHIDKRGILTDAPALANLREAVTKELNEKCLEVSGGLNNRPTVYSKDMGIKLARQLNVNPECVLNISSVSQLKNVLVNELKIKLKSVKNAKGEYRESTGEESLNEAFAATGNQVLKNVLRIRELNKFLGTYVDARLNDGVFHSCYSVTGTVTGRRASRQNFLGFGSNGQNQPKHSDLGEKHQGIFIARPRHIFLYCDQASAEEWIVQGIIADVSGDDRGIRELVKSIETGISRHAILASQIFGLPLEKTNNKECLEYFLGKKVRHAGNYDMRETTMAAQLAAAGFPVSIKFCAAILQKFHEVEPAIRNVFHRYIEHELCTRRVLRTPLGRERTFHGLRPYGDNSKVFREAYSFIPQSSIADNNGLAILDLQVKAPGMVLADGHDSILCEVHDDIQSVATGLALMKKAYDRVLRFPNGFEVRVPIDFKVGYTIRGLVKCPGDLNIPGLTNMYEISLQQQRVLRASTGGVESPVSAQLLSERSGLTELNGNSIQTCT